MNLDSLNTPFRQEDEVRLWEYIDGSGEASERAVIERLVSEDTIWRKKYNELLELHQVMQASELEEPSMRFTKNIMEEISKLHIAPAAKNYINKKVIWGIGGTMIAMIVGFLIYGIAQINWSEGSSYSSKGFDFSQVDYSKMFNNNLMNAFMMVNIVLGLILLDHYLANRKNRHIENS
jgi:hypothetical protein